MYREQTFRKAARDTAVPPSLFALPLTISLGLLTGLGLEPAQRWCRFGRHVFRTRYFLPYVTSVVAISPQYIFILLGTRLQSDQTYCWRRSGVDVPDRLNNPRLRPRLGRLDDDIEGARPPDVVVFPRPGCRRSPRRSTRQRRIDEQRHWRRFPLRRRCRCCGRRCCSRQWSAGSALVQLFEEPFVMTQGGPRLDADSRVPHLRRVLLRQLRLYGSDRLHPLPDHRRADVAAVPVLASDRPEVRPMTTTALTRTAVHESQSRRPDPRRSLGCTSP